MKRILFCFTFFLFGDFGTIQAQKLGEIYQLRNLPLPMLEILLGQDPLKEAGYTRCSIYFALSPPTAEGTAENRSFFFLYWTDENADGFELDIILLRDFELRKDNKVKIPTVEFISSEKVIVRASSENYTHIAECFQEN